MVAVWIARASMVLFLLYLHRLPASEAMRSNVSFTNEFMMLMALLLMPVSGCTCFSTL